jgi:serine/threonine protein kinase/response regulator RpfG family c-di-GMP phosphodiesterase
LFFGAYRFTAVYIMKNTILKNTYRLKEVIGKSGMSTVYLATDINLNKEYAVKELSLKDVNDSEALHRFKREAKIISAISHPEIAKIETVIEENKKYYIVMEYFDGEDLKKAKNKLTFFQKIKVISKTASVLDYIHKKGIIHRDIKPGNILVKTNGNDIDICIIDFGLAYLRDIKDIFEEKTIVGSLSYISPEQTGMLRRQIDSRSDLYSLGATFYELLTGKVPFAEKKAGKLIHLHLAKTPLAPSTYNSEIPPVIDDIVLKLLNKEPEERYQSANGLKEDLDYFLAFPEKHHFDLALKDKSLKLNYKIKLVGIDEEDFQIEDDKYFTYLVGGNTGCGKTRLLEDLREDFIFRNLIFIITGCSRENKNIPYSALHRMLKDYLENYIDDNTKNKIIKNCYNDLINILPLFPFIEKYFNVNPDDRMKPSVNEGRRNAVIYRSILNLFSGFFNNTNAYSVLAFDDVHDIDSDSLSVIKYIAESAGENLKLKLILAYEGESFKPDICLKLGRCKNIKLKNLKKSFIETFVQRVIGSDATFKEEFYDFLFDHSLGNPLNIIDTLKYLENNNIIFSLNYTWQLDYEKLKKVKLSGAKASLLLGRLCAFDQKEVKILEYAAIAGKSFSISSLEDFINVSENDCSFDKIICVADKAVEEQIFEETSKKGTYSFTHNNLYDNIYSKIDNERKKKLHEKFAEVLALKLDKSLAESIYKIAFHYNLSDNLEKMFEYNKKAYRVSTDNYALFEGSGYLRNIIDFMIKTSSDDKEELIKYIKEYSNSMQLTGRVVETASYLEWILVYIKQKGWKKESISILLLIGLAYYVLNENVKAMGYYNGAMVLASEIGEEIKDGIPYMLMGTAFLFSYNLENAYKNLTKAVEYIGKKDIDNYLVALGLRSWVYLFSGDFSKAFNDVKIAEANIKNIKDELKLTQILHSIAFYYVYSGIQPEKGIEYTAAAYNLALKTGNHLYEFVTLMLLMIASLFAGEYERAENYGAKCLKLSAEKKLYIGIKSALATYAMAKLYNCKAGEAFDIAKNNLSNLDLPHEIVSNIMFLIIISVNAYYNNDIESAKDEIEKAYKIVNKSGMHLYAPNILYIRLLIYKKAGDKKKIKELEKEIADFKEDHHEMDYLILNGIRFAEFVEEEKSAKDFEDSTHFNKSSTLIREKLQLESIIETSQIISSILDIDDLLNEILRRTLEVTGAQRGALMLCDKEGKRLEYKVIKSGEDKKFIVPKYIIKKVISAKKGYVHTGDIKNAKSNEISKTVILEGIKSVICSPLIFEERIIGLLYLDSKLIKSLFTEEDLEILNVFTSQAAISIVNAEKNAIIKKQFSDSIHLLTSMLATNSSRVYEHTNEVTRISVLLAKAIRCNNSEIEKIKIASMLKDAGNIELMEKYLFSQKSLTPEELEIFKEHPKKSAAIINHLEGVDDIKRIILQHQERCDGSGYPAGISNDMILKGAKIIGLVDDFVILTRMREYQSLDKQEKIIQKLVSEKGKLYDPEITEIFIEVIENEKLIYAVTQDDIKEQKKGSKLIWTVPSNLNFEIVLAEKIMAEVSKNVKLEEEYRFSVDFSICEIIRNAIIHGNKYTEKKKVKAELEFFEKESPSSERRFVITVTDEGNGMDISEHNRFTESRKRLFLVFKDFKNLKETNKTLEKDKSFEELLHKLNMFKQDYYTDFNSFRQIDSSEMSGGVGLIQVKSTFDNVYFKNIVKSNRIKGLEVKMEMFY